MSTMKKFLNVLGDSEEKPAALLRAASTMRAETMRFDDSDQNDNENEEKPPPPTEEQVFSSEDETAAATPTRRLNFDIERPTRVWNFMLKDLTYKQRREVRERRAVSEVKRAGKSEISFMERLVLELDEVFQSADNLIVRSLLRPKVIDLGPTDQPFVVDYPDFDVDKRMNATEVLDAYTWMKKTLKFCGYMSYKPTREDLAICLEEYRKDPLFHNRVLLETMQLSYNFATQLSQWRDDHKAVVPPSAKSVASKRSKSGLTPSHYKHSPVIADPPGTPADLASSVKSRKSTNKTSKVHTTREALPRIPLEIDSSGSNSDDPSADENLCDDSDDEVMSMPSRAGRYGAVNVMSVDTLPVFQGDEVGREAAYHWIQRFELLADASRWKEKAKITWFMSYLGKSVRGWFNQLSAKHKVSWKAIKRKFNKEYIMNPLPKSDKYHHMTQNPGEQLKAFFYRFNNAAIQANVVYWKHKEVLDEHISRFCMALEDEALGERLSQMSFSSIGALERHLDAQRKNSVLRRMKYRYSDHEQLGFRDPQGSLRPPRGLPPSKADIDRRYREREQDKRERPRRQVLVAMEDSDYESPPPTKSEYEIFTMGGKKEWCSKCNSEHYRLNGDCWKDIYCSICKRNGHPVSRCHKACQLCDPPHNKYDPCESREQIVQVKAFLDALARSGRDDVPSLDRLNC